MSDHDELGSRHKPPRPFFGSPQDRAKNFLDSLPDESHLDGDEVIRNAQREARARVYPLTWNLWEARAKSARADQRTASNAGDEAQAQYWGGMADALYEVLSEIPHTHTWVAHEADNYPLGSYEYDQCSTCGETRDV